ncbi:hypothetical protein [Sphaerisporangium aureirubrum]|uniref:Uncharacterized protein n=1 Tax=Sphaerisporangium aureirubrum TaxID=1544736 RepID=A0ABW1NJM9_9ACTN
MIAAFTDEEPVEDLRGVHDVGAEEDGSPDTPDPWMVEPPGPGEWMDIGPNGVTLHAKWDAQAYVRYELWTAPPPRDPTWQKTWTGEVHLTTGRIASVSSSEGFVDHGTPFDLGRPATTWNLRVRWKPLVNAREPGFPDDAYRADLFTLQFWPPQG